MFRTLVQSRMIIAVAAAAAVVLIVGMVVASAGADWFTSSREPTAASPLRPVPAAQQDRARRLIARADSLPVAEVVSAQFPTSDSGLAQFGGQCSRPDSVYSCHTFAYATTADGWKTVHYGILGDEMSPDPGLEVFQPAVTAGLANGYLYVNTFAVDGEQVIDPATGGRHVLKRDYDTRGVIAEADDLLVLDHLNCCASNGISVIDTDNWTVVPIRPPARGDFLAISQQPGDARIWAIAGDLVRDTPHRLFHTEDGGATWAEAALPASVGTGHFTAAASDDKLAVLGSDAEQMFISDNAGQTWTAVPLPSGASGALQALADGRLLIGGAEVSTDSTWRHFTPLPRDTGTVHVATSGAMYRTGSSDAPPPNRDQLQVSWDGGSTWDPLPIPR